MGNNNKKKEKKTNTTNNNWDMRGKGAKILTLYEHNTYIRVKDVVAYIQHYIVSSNSQFFFW